MAGVLERLALHKGSFGNADALLRSGGLVTAVAPHFYRVRGLSRSVQLGDVVAHHGGQTGRRGEVIRIEHPDVTVSPFRDARYLRVGDTVFNHGPLVCRPNDAWLGRVFNALGEPIDGKGSVANDVPVSEHSVEASGILGRARVSQPFQTGVRAIDIFTPLCYGQRFGLFAGSGVGKSTLLAMLTRAEAFDAVVVALVGERSREVREFVEETVGPEDLAKCAFVVATGDESAIMRRRAPECAMQIAEHFRDSGKRVLLLLDSLTRYAHALRETAISVDEAPVARGYPSSVFTDLPKLLERAGPGGENGGSITAILSVLIDGDDHNDPVADTVRGLLDGHLVMQRSIADQGRYPPIDPLSSISRLANKVWSNEQTQLVLQLRAMISRFEDTSDLRLMGAWQPGADAQLDQAVQLVPRIYEALTQLPDDPLSVDPFAELAATLKATAEEAKQEAPEPEPTVQQQPTAQPEPVNDQPGH